MILAGSISSPLPFTPQSPAPALAGSAHPSAAGGHGTGVQVGGAWNDMPPFPPYSGSKVNYFRAVGLGVTVGNLQVWGL